MRKPPLFHIFETILSGLHLLIEAPIVRGQKQYSPKISVKPVHLSCRHPQKNFSRTDLQTHKCACTLIHEVWKWFFEIFCFDRAKKWAWFNFVYLAEFQSSHFCSSNTAVKRHSVYLSTLFTYFPSSLLAFSHFSDIFSLRSLIPSLPSFLPPPLFFERQVTHHSNPSPLFFCSGFSDPLFYIGLGLGDLPTRTDFHSTRLTFSSKKEPFSI